MSIIKVEHLTFTHQGSFETLFHDVSFQLDTEWKTGLIGRNGKGKTTLLHLLMKRLPYQGSIQSNVIFDLFPFEINDKQQTTSSIAQQISPQSEAWQIIKELSLLQVKEEVLERPFETLSYGEQTKVMLAILFSQSNHYLLIDEPTNHLDGQARKLLSNYLKKKRGFILVSHDRSFLDLCIDHVISINRSKIEVQQGNFSTWKQNKDYQDQFELAENERLQKDIGRLKESAHRQAQWSNKVEATKIGHGVADRGFVGAQAARVMKKGKNTEKRMKRAIVQKEALLHDLDHAPSLKLTTLEHHRSCLLTLDRVWIHYDQGVVAGPISFSLHQGERLAILGVNGSGKSSLIRCFTQDAQNYTGVVTMAPQLKISEVRQDTGFLQGLCTTYAQAQGIDLTLFLTVLRKLDFRRELFERPMESYSEGQKKKVLIAASLSKPAHLLIWDEPLNFIDVLSRIQIEQLILSFKPTMIVIEHDQSFIESIATKTIQL